MQIYPRQLLCQKFKLTDDNRTVENILVLNIFTTIVFFFATSSCYDHLFRFLRGSLTRALAVAVLVAKGKSRPGKECSWWIKLESASGLWWREQHVIVELKIGQDATKWLDLIAPHIVKMLPFALLQQAELLTWKPLLDLSPSLLWLRK